MNGVKEDLDKIDQVAEGKSPVDVKEDSAIPNTEESPAQPTENKCAEMNGVSKEPTNENDNDIDTNTDIEMDEEEKLLDDAESVDSPSLNEDSLLNSDNDNIDSNADEPSSQSPMENGDKENAEDLETAKVIKKESDDADNILDTDIDKQKSIDKTENSVKTEPESEDNAKERAMEVDDSATESEQVNCVDKPAIQQTAADKAEYDDNIDDECQSNDENAPPADDLVSETEEERRANRLKVQFDRVELLKDDLRSEEATLTLLRKLLDSQRGKNGYKSSSKPQPSQMSNIVHSKPPAQVVQKQLPPKQPPVQQKPPPPTHNTSQPVQKYYIQVGNQLVPAPPPSTSGSNTVYQYANGTSPHSYQPPPPPKPAPPPKQTPEQKKNAAKAALRRQLEQTLLQIPPPRPPPADWKAVPNVNSMDFMMLVGLDEVVDTILEIDNKPTLKKALENLTPYNPRICSQCKVDFSPCWKAAKNNNMDGFVLCERCALQNVKKELKAEHTARLKAAFMKALKQEQEIEEKIKAGEEVNIAGITGSEKQDPQPSNHSPNTPQHQPSSNRNSSPKLSIAVPPPAPSSGSHASSPPDRHHQPSSGHHRHHQVVQHYPHHTSLVQQLHHQHIQQQQLELEPSPRHSSRWHPYMSSSSSHHRDHHPVHHRSYVPGSSTSEGSPRQEYYVVHHPHQNVRYVTR